MDPYKPSALIADIEVPEDLREYFKWEKEREFERGRREGVMNAHMGCFTVGVVAGMLVLIVVGNLKALIAWFWYLLDKAT